MTPKAPALTHTVWGTAEGKDVVSLTAGEPDCSPPDFVIEAIQRSLARGETRYTAVPGIAELRRAIAKRSSRGELRYGENDVIVSSGAKQSVFNAVLEPAV